MNTRERFVRTLTGQPVDRVPFIKVFGQANHVLPHWEAEHPGLRKQLDAILQFEGQQRGWARTPVNMDPSQLDKVKVLEETETTLTRMRGDGRVEKIHKGGDYKRHTVSWPVKTRDDWERFKARHLQPDDPERFPPNWAALVEEYRTRDYPLQLTHRGVYGFPREIMGDEALAYAFCEAPELVHDIMATYTDMALAVWEKMVKGVQFDLIECWEDMAYRAGALVSPWVFREFMAPQYRRIAAFAKAHGIPIVLVDSDGQIEALTEWMVEAGVTALYPYEVQSGNDVGRVRQRCPTVGVIGALNKQVMAQGRAAIDREIERARGLIRMGRLIPGPDHFVLSDVSWANYRYFMERLREAVMTTTPGQ